MNTDGDRRGREIAKLLWPKLWFVPPGSFWDKYGIDAYLDAETIQVKYDSRIAQSGNIYHEIYEKSEGCPWQPWRWGPGKVTSYIFTTETPREVIGYKVAVNDLAEAEAGMALTAITPRGGDRTSMGFIIPPSRLTPEIRRLEVA